jgi:hypothetical protein
MPLFAARSRLLVRVFGPQLLEAALALRTGFGWLEADTAF